jgi:hypothetical protein
MITVRMVQPTVHKIVDMVTMRHHFMSAVWTVRMRAVDLRRALHRICRVDRDRMLVHVILVHVVEMAIVSRYKRSCEYPLRTLDSYRCPHQRSQ